MAITVEGTPTSSQGDGTSAACNVPTVSGGILAGDFLVMIFCSCESEDNTTSTPSGMDGEWLSETQVGQTPPSVPGMQVFYELCSGGESGTRTATLSFASGWMCIMFVLRGVDTTTPLDVTPTTAQSTVTGDPDPPSITPTNDDCLILALGIQDATGAATLTNYSSGYTGLGFENNNQATGGCLAACYNILSGGASTPENPGAINTSLTDEWGAATLAFRPGATATLEQEAFRFRNDDGSESGATWRQNQDVDDSIAKETRFRLRANVNSTGDAPSQQYRLDYKESGDAATEWRPVPLT